MEKAFLLLEGFFMGNTIRLRCTVAKVKLPFPLFSFQK